MARKKAAPRVRGERHSQRIEKLETVRDAQKAAAQPIKPKSFRRPRQRKGCHLLNLPGELRNQIFDFAVVEPSAIRVTSKGLDQPALLKTCRQIRREAGTIYYGSNEFDICLERYNGAAFVPFARQARRFDTRYQEQSIRFIFDFNPDWDNVVAWIQAYHMDGAFVPGFENPRLAELKTLASAFRLALDSGFWSWAQKEKALDTLYQALRGTDSEWVKEGDRFLY